MRSDSKLIDRTCRAEISNRLSHPPSAFPLPRIPRHILVGSSVRKGCFSLSPEALHGAKLCAGPRNDSGSGEWLYGHVLSCPSDLHASSGLVCPDTEESATAGTGLAGRMEYLHRSANDYQDRLSPGLTRDSVSVRGVKSRKQPGSEPISNAISRSGPRHGILGQLLPGSGQQGTRPAKETPASRPDGYRTGPDPPLKAAGMRHFIRCAGQVVSAAADRQNVMNLVFPLSVI
jgi:hypothetical protein